MRAASRSYCALQRGAPPALRGGAASPSLAARHSPARPQIAEFVAAIRKPRAIIILVQAGKPVDDTIEVRGAGSAGPRATRGV